MEKWVRKSQEVSMLLIGADVGGKDEGTELSEEASLLVILV
jgi:hypothetical protein